jgi:hypothetical protein
MWLDEFERLLPDIREVLGWALVRDPARAGAVICRVGPGFGRGRATEARTWLERLLQQRSALPDDVVANALALLGMQRWGEEDLDGAAAVLRESIEGFERLGNRLMAAWATTTYAHTLRARGEHADAIALYERHSPTSALSTTRKWWPAR